LDRKASYTWGKRGIERTQGRSCILLHNTSQSALTLFEFQEAEELARKALRAERQDCPNPSYEHLANIYLVQGQFNKAVSAFKKLVRYPVERRYRPQFFMGNRSILVELLFALGKVEEGLKLSQQVFDAPDRAGMTSVSSDDIAFVHGFGYWLMLDQRIQQLEDQTALRSLFSRVDRTVDKRGLQLTRFEVGRRLQRLAMVEEILVTNLRPYLRGVKPWYAGHLIDAVGAGLFSAALDRAEALDAPVAEKVVGYYASLRGEVAYKDGSWDDAIQQGGDALRVLPKEMALLRWRTMAYVAAARIATGDAGGDTLSMLREVLHKYPTALRHLDIAVPVRVQIGGSGDAEFLEEVAEAIEDSPRFTLTNAGFVADLRMKDADLELCLRTADGFRFGCASYEVDTKSNDDAIAAVDTFVETVLSPRVEMTAADINSLDGSTVRVTADQILDGLLEGPKKPGEEDEE
ncbi:MAG: tetratricopeptide (TPR) repeat protein, partial [Myxococcota bacterium]